MKNAFNSAQWSHVLDAMTSKKVPAYISRMIASYFSNRTLIYETAVGRKTYEITGGVPLWNIMYDALLRLALPRGAKTIGCANDVAVVVADKYLEEVT